MTQQQQQQQQQNENENENLITVIVKLLPEPYTDESSKLTRFQARAPSSKYYGVCKTFKNLDKTTELVSDLMKRVERESGEKIEMLRRGGTFEGVVLDPTKTLQECGIEHSMGIFEYLWEDSTDNVKKYKEEKERMFKILPYHEKFLEEYNEGRPTDVDDEFLEKRFQQPTKKEKEAKEKNLFEGAELEQLDIEAKLDAYNDAEDKKKGIKKGDA
jgi:hypothetical protein